MKYPNGAKNQIDSNIVNDTKATVFANRGMDFEKSVSLSASYYLEQDLAVIYKRPTPIHVVKVDYAHNFKITDAYFEKQSTTDYNGVYKGRYIDFECKETKSTTSLSFHNIPSQQIKHLKSVIRHQGIAFFLIYFITLQEVYLIDASYIIEAYEKGDRKSITLKQIKENGYLVEQGYRPRLDFLKIVEKVYFHGNI